MKVINPLYLPFRCPLHLTITLMLMIEVKSVEGVLLGLTYSLIGLLWLAYIVALLKEKWFTPQEAEGNY